MPSPEERIAQLEKQVQTLAEIVGGIIHEIADEITYDGWFPNAEPLVWMITDDAGPGEEPDPFGFWDFEQAPSNA